MFQNFKKKQNNKENEQSAIDKNLKLMSVSAAVLIALFIYISIKSEHLIEGTSYYGGIIFLFVLMILTFALQKYKDKIRAKIPKNKFQAQMQTASSEKIKEKSYSHHHHDNNDNNNNNTNNELGTIEPITCDITFRNIAGIQEIKEELEEVVDFLNNPKKYQKFDVNLPKGVLLVGPPGVGKTLIAKAVAGEAQVPFFYQSGASFVHIYVGMGAKKVRELFSKAKASAPSIVFIDEIDAVGKQRGLGSNDEREATLNELLTQMDGFSSSSGVMVIAATNKIEVLDEALLRAGRFDRRLFLNLPNSTDRAKILDLYLKNKKYDFDIKKLVSETSGFSSSALSTLINEALLAMIKRGDKVINEDDIELSKQKIQFGKKQFHLIDESQKDILATYQAGKAFISKSKVCLFDCEISLSDDIVYPSKTQLEDKIKKYLAGAVTLEIIKGEPYAINENELQEAYSIATKMVEDLKMEDSVEKIIINIKSQLQTMIKNNIENINELKEKLLKDEVVVF